MNSMTRTIRRVAAVAAVAVVLAGFGAPDAAAQNPIIADVIVNNPTIVNATVTGEDVSTDPGFVNVVNNSPLYAMSDQP